MSLVLICLLGVALVVYSRNERLHPAAATQPAVGGTPWYAALALDVCGKAETGLPANPSTKKDLGIVTSGDGVIRSQPATGRRGRQRRAGRFIAAAIPSWS